MENGRRGRIILGIFALLFGFSLGGIQAHTVLYSFSTLPFRNLLGVAIVFGVLIHWWMGRIEDSLLLTGFTVVVVFMTSVGVQMTPALRVGREPALVNVLLLDALQQAIIFTAGTALLLALGVFGAYVFGGVDPNGRVVPSSVRNHTASLRSITTLLLVGIGISICVLLIGNYTAALHQQDVTAEMVEIDEQDERFLVGVEYENRFSHTLHVSSISVRLADEDTWITVNRGQSVFIDPEATATISLLVECETLVEREIHQSEELTISGTLYVTATSLNDYTLVPQIEERTISNPCART